MSTISSAAVSAPAIPSDTKVIEADKLASTVFINHEPRMQLGEGIIYRPKDQTLHYLDIERSPVSALYIAQLDKDGSLVSGPREIEVKGSRHVTALAFRKSHPGSYLCTTHTGLAHLSEEDGTVKHLPNGLGEIISEDRKRDMRFNDGFCDEKGRFYFHSMSRDENKKDGKLYMYEKGMNGKEDLKVLEEGFAIGNGPVIDETRRKFYFNFTEQCKGFVYDYDPSTGGISNRQVFFDNTLRRPSSIATPSSLIFGSGGPDGHTIDTAGNVYQAVFGRSLIERFTPEGRNDLSIKLPARCATCPIFAGENQDILYVTTASEPLQPGEAALTDDQGGNILRIDLKEHMNGAKGVTKPQFDG